MKAKYEFIHFEQEDADVLKHPAFICRNNKTNDELGCVQWYHPWRQYCYFPTQPAVYSVGCLTDINSFIAQLVV